MKHHAVIIGSGIAGIATSIRLAVAGYDVKVFEKNDYLGGKLSAFEYDGYKFDAGPSLFTQPEYIESLFTLANKNVNEYFTYTKSPISCAYFFADGTQLLAPSNKAGFVKEVVNTLNENEVKVEQYLQHAAIAFENIGTLFTQYSLHKSSSYKNGRLIKALKATRLPYLTKTMDAYNKTYFKNKNTVQLFNRFATYNGSNPYKAPAMLSMIPHFEINVGTYYPYGGMIAITNALVQLAKDVGVTFKTNAAIDKINLENDKISSVQIKGTSIQADYVVSNMDIYYTYKKLLSNDDLANKILKQERSSSAFIFYWGINTSFPQLHLHNILFSSDYIKEFAHIFNLGTIGDDITVYINITSKMEANQAPNGCENWFVMINAPAHKDQNWTQETNRLKLLVIEKIKALIKVDIAKHIVYESVLTPKDIETKTSSHMGSLYGTSSNGKFAAFLRQSNQSTHFKNLFFVGGSVHPGGGIPLCLGSAKIVGDILSKP
jgi:diapolycopene oxygenase